MSVKVTVTMVFEIDRDVFREHNPLTTETVWGIPVDVSLGDRIEELERLLEEVDLRERGLLGQVKDEE